MQSLLSSQGFGVVNGHSARGIGERFHQLPTVRRGAAPRTHLTPFNFFFEAWVFLRSRARGERGHGENGGFQGRVDGRDRGR
jgi:hypothetical protein